MKYVLRPLIILSLLFLTTHCANFGSMQTGRVLKQEESFHAVGLKTFVLTEENTQTSSESDGDTDEKKSSNNLMIPTLEYMYRQGLRPNLEAGFDISMYGRIGANLKYGLLDGERFALATGLNLSYFNPVIKDGSDDDTKPVQEDEDEDGFDQKIAEGLKFLYVSVPLYLSYDINEKFTIYGSTKYLYNLLESFPNDSIFSHSLGFKYGKKSGIFMEASFVSDEFISKDSSLMQVGISIFWLFQ